MKKPKKWVDARCEPVYEIEQEMRVLKRRIKLLEYKVKPMKEKLKAYGPQLGEIYRTDLKSNNGKSHFIISKIDDPHYHFSYKSLEFPKHPNEDED